MSVEREEREIDRVIELFPKITGISERKKERFEALVARLQEAQSDHNLLVSQQDLGIEALRDKLIVAETLFVSTEAELKKVRQWVKRGPDDELPGRLPVIVNRIRVLLSTAKLPWILTPLKRFALHEHPDILPAFNRKDVADVSLQAAREEFEKGTEVVREKFGGKIEETRERLAARRKTLVSFVDEQAVASRQSALLYAQYLPERADIIARLYAQEKAASSEELGDFLEFIKNRLVGATTRQMEVWYSRWEWFVQGRSPSTAEYDLLPKNIKDDWKEYVEERFLDDFNRGRHSL